MRAAGEILGQYPDCGFTLGYTTVKIQGMKDSQRKAFLFLLNGSLYILCPQIFGKYL